MNTVGEMACGIAHDAIEEEWIERDVVPFGEVAIDRVETFGVLFPHAWRRVHPGKQHLDVLLAQFLEDLREIVGRHFGIDPAQHVVGAEFEDDRIRAVAKRPVEAGEAAGRRIAGDAAVDDRDIVALLTESRLQLWNEPVSARQQVTGREAVAERDEAQRPRRRLTAAEIAA